MTSDEMMEIASELLMNGCDKCTFYELEKCDSKPLNCCWLKLYSTLKHYEKQNNEETDNELHVGKN